MLQTLDVAGINCVFVGDSLKNDILGASNCGIPSIWVNRDARTDRRSSAARHEVASLRDVTVGLIHRLTAI